MIKKKYSLKKVMSTTCILWSLSWVLSGCGGGGGGGTTTGTTNTPTPTPTPSLPIPTSDRAPAAPYVVGAGHNLFARTHLDLLYTQGLGGETSGGAVAVLDDGVVASGTPFPTGKVIQGRNFMTNMTTGLLYTNPGYTGDARHDTSGLQGGGVGPLTHGTAVASIIGGYVDPYTGEGGVAYNARILPVRVINTGTVATDVPNATDARPTGDARLTGDIYSAAALAILDNGGTLNAIREGLYYVSQQPDTTVRVANMSIFGPSFEAQAQAFAIAGLSPNKVYVFAAGNHINQPPLVYNVGDPTPFGSYITFNPALNPGNVLVVGTVDGANTINNLSAGNCADFFLVTPGDATSYAAPVVAASAYTILSNWPALTGAEVCQILLKTANKGAGGDLGNALRAGQGMLNMKAAMMPLGVLAVPVAVGLAPYTQTTAWLNTLLTALQNTPGAFGPVLTFDAYQRDFYADLNTRIQMRPNPSGVSSFFENVLHRVTQKTPHGFLAVSEKMGFAFGSSPFESSTLNRHDDASAEHRPSSLTTHGFWDLTDRDRLGMTLGSVQPFTGWMPAPSPSRLFSRSDHANLWSLFPHTFDSAYGQHTWNNHIQWGYQYMRARPSSEGSMRLTAREAITSRESTQAWVAHASFKVRGHAVVNCSMGRLEETSSWLGNQGRGALSLGRRHVSHFAHIKTHVPIGSQHAVTLYATGVRTPGQKITGSLITEVSDTVALGYGISSEHRIPQQGILHFHIGVPLHVVQGKVLLQLPRMADPFTRRLAFESRDISLRSSARECTFEAGYEQPILKNKAMAYGVTTTYHLQPQQPTRRAEAGILGYWKCTL